MTKRRTHQSVRDRRASEVFEALDAVHQVARTAHRAENSLTWRAALGRLVAARSGLLDVLEDKLHQAGVSRQEPAS
jgi:hypothetical protein